MLSLFGLAASSPAFTWSDQPHTVICQIAFDELNNAAKAEVTRLIKQDTEFTSFAESCTWPDHPRQRDIEHFVNLPREDAENPDVALAGDKCPNDVPCVLSAIDKDLAVLKDHNATDADKLASLKFLGHWVGDVHQPLHVSFADDRGGNDIAIEGHLCRGNLNAVWDVCIFVENFGNDLRQTAAKFRSEITDADRSAWTASGPVDWAKESFAITTSKTVEYCVMQSDGSCWYTADREEWKPGSKKKKVQVGSEYVALHGPTVKNRIERAGIRLAKLLNETLGQ
jgi:hypothetical protein